jgi:hypothetical protein
MRALLISSDLLFASRIRSAGRRQGVECTAASLGRSGLDIGPDVPLVLIDLAHTGTEPLEALLKELRRRDPSPHVIAYGPHVDGQVLEFARAAGCDEVLTRGQFDRQLEEIFLRYGQQTNAPDHRPETKSHHNA